MRATVIGAGLAGCEAAYKLAEGGVKVTLCEMKPEKFSPAHRNENFCELVCSNSLKAERIGSASGLLKEELRRLGSLTLSCAYKTRVPAGGALAVDRELFSKAVTESIESSSNITVVTGEITSIPLDEPTIVATGPLTSEALSADIMRLCGEELYFYDAAAPIVSFSSVDMSRAFFAARYSRGDPDDYINCPLNKEEYTLFREALVNAKAAELHAFDNPSLADSAGLKVYEGCMPIEVLAARGEDSIRFGPLKPVGLRDPRTERRPWAVVQLRRENVNGDMYNLVGFQTNLKFPEQKRVFSLIPALHNAEFLRYGVMHRNTFLNSPRLLTSTFRFKERGNLFFAGQMTGVEGYMESAMSGLVAAVNLLLLLKGKNELPPPAGTMSGELCRYISTDNADFQPMGANMGLLPPLDVRIKDKQARYEEIAGRSLKIFKGYEEALALAL